MATTNFGQVNSTTPIYTAAQADSVLTLSPQWIKVTKSYTDFATAGLTNDIEIYSLPAGAMIHRVIIKHTTAFAGGTISAYTLSVGVASNLVKYATAFNVFQAVDGTTLQLSNNLDIENWDAATSIRGAAISVTGLLDAATTGTVEFHLLVSTAKQ